MATGPYPTIQAAIAGILGKAYTYVRGFNLNPALGPIHHGIDISAVTGTPVPALTNGTVVFSGFAGGGGTGYVNPYSPPTNASQANAFYATGGGNTVVIQDPNGMLHIEAHLSTISVHVGQAITAGTTVGTVGSTGDATGPHLHYGIVNPATNSFIDPTAFFEKLGGISDSQYAPPTDPITGAANALGNAITGVGLFVGIIFVGAVLVLVAALVSRNSVPAPATA